MIHNLDGGDYLEKLLDDLQKGKTDPQNAAEKLMSRFASKFKKQE